MNAWTPLPPRSVPNGSNLSREGGTSAQPPSRPDRRTTPPQGRSPNRLWTRARCTSFTPGPSPLSWMFSTPWSDPSELRWVHPRCLTSFPVSQALGRGDMHASLRHESALCSCPWPRPEILTLRVPGPITRSRVTQGARTASLRSSSSRGAQFSWGSLLRSSFLLCPAADQDPFPLAAAAVEIVPNVDLVSSLRLGRDDDLCAGSALPLGEFLRLGDR